MSTSLFHQEGRKGVRAVLETRLREMIELVTKFQSSLQQKAQGV